MRRRGIMRHARLLAIAAVAMLVATSCNNFFQETAEEHQQSSPDTRPWWCHSADHGGGHDGHGAEHYEGVEKGMLSWSDCLALSGQLDDVLEWANQWPTRGDAEAAGFYPAVNYATGMGTHHRAPGADFNDAFDPTRPEFLQYGGERSRPRRSSA
ncbi:MAG: hypothetical protein U5R31_09390 [Acidimicrobiia bacterium]|nr:hypothetical protein [Acidimicrobiia bacterium]